MDPIIRILVFVLPLLINLQQAAQHSTVAIEIDGENWKKTTTLDHGRHSVGGSSDINTNIPGAEESAANDNVLRLHSMDMDIDHDDDQHVGRRQADNDDDDGLRDPAELVFFNLEKLMKGKTMLAYFRNGDPSLSEFLAKEEADKIPFSLKQLPTILQLFSISQGSPQAKQVEHALKSCQKKPAKGEICTCVTSISSLLDFARGVFGINNYTSIHDKVQIVSTIYLKNLTTEVQKYTITEVPKQFLTSKAIVCHIVPYPYKVLFCHHVDKTKAYRVHLLSEHGDKIQAIAVCHFDTSQVQVGHVSLRRLGINRGDGRPICHFLPADNIVLLPSSSTTTSN